MTNKEILTAVVIEWIKPVIPMIIGNRLNQLPVLNMFQNWVKNLGIAPPNWTLAQDISPIIQGAAYNLLTPFIFPRLDKVPDEYIPEMAHGIVDAAILSGGLNLLGGYISFDKDDMQELKNYLDYNLPYTPKERYQVIKPEAAGEQNEPQNVELKNEKL